MNKKPTIIFGGAFNPPTVAHEAMLQACVQTAQNLGADIWILPSGERTDKSIGVALERRIKYIEAMIADVSTNGIEVSINRYELEKGGMINTYDTARYFEEAHPDRSFIWVFGADSMVTMRQWPGGDWLMESTDKIVFERDGIDCADFKRVRALCRVDAKGVSSTELRRRLSEGEDYRQLVGAAVYALLSAG